MKNLIKKISLTEIILLLITIVGVFVATGCSKNTQLVPILQEKEIDTTQVSELHITTEFTRIHIVPSNNNEIQFKLHGQITAKYRDQVSLQVTEENHRVKIQVNEPKNYRNLNIDEHQLDIGLPQRTFDLINIKGATAEVSINGVSADNFEINSAQGNIQLAHLYGNEFNINSTIGHITLENINGDTKVSTEQGKVSFIGDLGKGNRSVVTKVSDIDFGRVKLPEAWVADLTTIQGTITGTLEQFTLTQQVKEWKGNKGTGGAKVEVSTKQGNILFP